MPPCRKKDPQTFRSDLMSAIRAHNYKLAVTIADKALKTEKTDKNYFSYMKAFSWFRQKEFEKAKELLIKLSKNTKSKWIYKANFLLAKIYLQQKNYKLAQEIYAKQAHRLHSSKRKEEIASIYIQFAEKLSTKPADTNLKAHKVDYYAAYKFYNKAIQLKPGKKLTEKLYFKLAELMFLAKDRYKAINDFVTYLKKYDPDWVISDTEKKESITGQYCKKARYYLAQCYLSISNYEKAREILRDLSKTLKADDKLLEDVIWKITQTFYSSDVENYVHSLNTYLKKFPKGLYSVDAAYKVVNVYMENNRTQEAITAINHFLQKKTSKF